MPRRKRKVKDKPSGRCCWVCGLLAVDWDSTTNGMVCLFHQQESIALFGRLYAGRTNGMAKAGSDDPYVKPVISTNTPRRRQRPASNY